MRTDRQDRAGYSSENLFGNRTEEDFCDPGAASRRNDDEIGVVLFDGALQAGLNLPFLDQHFRVDSRKSIEELVAVRLIKNSRGYDIGLPGGRLGHWVNDRRFH